ncbi:TPA: hypothetical protein N0F65_002809 [Lagenidium giganteum]|uniref:Secreted protein n=1 Tax=Lagenidium giganteum TaxID=4803 RepID=A0AAV2Z7Q1_9STRA|nr:TPA: hypothetical protein N0F65_002809 [Lagenidium giganteum]
MKICVKVVVAALAAFSSALVRSQTTPLPSSTTSADADGAFHMTPVRAIHARIQNDAPKWDVEAQQFYTPYAKNFSEGYAMALDGANTASVEGALMYMQAEGIDVTHQSNKCERKNKMAYVVFYDITFVQPNASLAEFGQGDNPEYGPMLSFDGGKCTNAGDAPPMECLMMNGEHNTADIGPFVGGLQKETDKRAPYPETLWFSFPSSCPTLGWKDDKAECRTKSHRVLCAPYENPDGVNCIFKYKILGYLGLDDLVGITAEGKYKNFKEFCEAGNVEFKTDPDSGAVTDSIAFWKDPTDTTANQARAQKMIDAYDNIVHGKSEINTVVPPEVAQHFEALPTPEQLATGNPECYKNALQCATKACKRTGYSQFCKACSDASPSCVAPPAGYAFPKLAKAVAPVPSNSGSGSAVPGIVQVTSSSGSGFSPVGTAHKGTANKDSTTSSRNGKPKSTASMAIPRCVTALVGILVIGILS